MRVDKKEAKAPAPSRVRLAELTSALSLVADVGMGQPMGHGLRSCLIATNIGAALGLSNAELADVYYLTLLRLVGCTAETHVQAEIFGDENAARTWLAAIDYGRPEKFIGTFIARVGADLPPLRRAGRVGRALLALPKLLDASRSHCEVARDLAKRMGVAPRIQRLLAQVFERYDGRGAPAGLKGDAIARPVRIVQVAQDVEIFYRMGGVDAALGVLRQRKHAYDPAVVTCVNREGPRLLARLEAGSIWEMALDHEPGRAQFIEGERIDEALRAMADFADLKSTYRLGHSSSVARLAAEAAKHLNRPLQEVSIVRRAALVHDIGIPGVSSSIWDKKGPLSDIEWERVRLHTYYAERALDRVKTLGDVPRIAAGAHERIDGSGYHRRTTASSAPLLARVLAASDAFQAMTEGRPHRAALPIERAADELGRAARAGKIDREVADAVLAAAGQRRPSRVTGLAGLSAREIEVLGLVARGLTNREMAAELGISAKTVGHHVQHIYDKIGVSTRAAATLFAMEHELL